MQLFKKLSAILHRQRSRIARGIWSGMDAAATPLASLAMTAGLVRALGAEAYGIVVVVLAVSALSLAINPAISAATTKFISEAVGAGKNVANSVPRVIAESVLAVGIIGAGFLSITYVFSAPLSRLLFGGRTTLSTTGLAAILLLAVLTVCIQQIDGVFSAALRGLERFKEQALFELTSRAIVAASTIATAFATHDIHSVLTANCVALAISAVLRGAYVRLIAPGNRLFIKPTRSDLKKLLGFGSWMWLSATATAAFGTVDRIIVGRILGPQAVAEYQVYVQLSQLVHYIPSSIFAFTFPAFSRLSAVKSDGAAVLKTLYLKTFTAVVSLAVTIAITLILWGHSILVLISGGRLGAADSGPLYCLIVGFTVLAANVAPYYLLLGTGRSRNVSLVTSLSVGASIIGAAILIPLFGLWGAAMARLVYVAGTLLLMFSARNILRNQHA